MAHHYSFCVCVVAITVATLNAGIGAVEYVVTNKEASKLFDDDVGADYAKQTMDAATNFIWTTFHQTTDADRKSVPTVTLSVESRADVDIAATAGDAIYFNPGYIERINGDIKTEFNGVLYHEMTHVWQWDGNGYAQNKEIIEGIADFVRLKGGYALSRWVQPGGGDNWKQSSDVTARFLDYCDGLRNGFVAELNKKMRDSYSDDFFAQLLGKSVDQLWSEYKAKYNNNNGGGR